uniref:Uncharacterized protein n=1 Tax=Oryza punctata TaxID=4537 RepID=A0A0E0KD77_ORYPU
MGSGKPVSGCAMRQCAAASAASALSLFGNLSASTIVYVFSRCNGQSREKKTRRNGHIDRNQLPANQPHNSPLRKLVADTPQQQPGGGARLLVGDGDEPDGTAALPDAFDRFPFDATQRNTIYESSARRQPGCAAMRLLFSRARSRRATKPGAEGWHGRRTGKEARA